MSNRNVSLLSREELESEYERVSFALAHALIKLDYSFTITDADLQKYNFKSRIWYTRDDAHREWLIELREDDGT